MCQYNEYIFSRDFNENFRTVVKSDDKLTGNTPEVKISIRFRNVDNFNFNPKLKFFIFGQNYLEYTIFGT